MKKIQECRHPLRKSLIEMGEIPLEMLTGY